MNELQGDPTLFYVDKGQFEFEMYRDSTTKKS